MTLERERHEASMHALTIAIPSFGTRLLLEVLLPRVSRWAPRAEVLVVDTGSCDGSRAWVRGFDGAVLLTIDDVAPGAAAHGAALDLALARATRPYLLTLDSDAIPLGPAFFLELLARIEGECPGGGARGRPVAAVGTRKDPRALGRINRWWRRLRGGRWGPEWWYLRPNRALYRVEVLRRLGLSFAPRGRLKVGEALAYGLEAARERVVVLEPDRMEALCAHLRHGTLALNPQCFPGARRRDVRKARQRLRRFLRSIGAEPTGQGAA